MGRPKWTPATDDQRRAVAAAKTAADNADNADQLMWQAVQAALDTGVPPAYMAEAVKRGRATLYRHTTPPGKSTVEPVPQNEER